ncbi:hypothetical protein AMS59_18360 [Lysinibacillus sp. FJAT-14745]|nr:hypothetical protein AMS59_18360 [Lysinibacillus sp. FJAT-14745]
MSCLGQQMFFERKRSANVAAAANVLCAKVKRQRQMFFARKRSANVATATTTRCRSRGRYHRK